MKKELYDIDGNVIKHHNLQDKTHWCKEGEKLEISFVREYGEKLKYILNPDKTKNECAPDLINTKTNNLADLKVQNTPFFKAKELYGIEPTYAVVFNEKDKDRYENYYPDIEIVYYVNWLVLKAVIKNRIYTTPGFKAIFKAEFPKLRDYLSTLKIHYYKQREFDTKGNAKGSYVLDIRNPVFTQIT